MHGPRLMGSEECNLDDVFLSRLQFVVDVNQPPIVESHRVYQVDQLGWSR